MWELVLYITGGLAVFIIFAVLIVSVIRDRKMSKEWHRIFKEDGRDD